MTNTTSKDDALEKWLDEQLTGKWATGDLETDLRMAVSTIRGMSGKTPKDYAVQPLMRFIKQYGVQERIDELSHLGFDKRLNNPILSCYDVADFGAITLDERLTALKDKQKPESA
ncbi:hypothetical protein [Rhodococcus erythropolis]|uniref:hypothetical protein n=1 Tax=Rhodococcus erythropolis TaxID=1833 RepID=UPI003013A31C